MQLWCEVLVCLAVVLDHKTDSSCDTGLFELIYRQAPITDPPQLDTNLCVEGKKVKASTDLLPWRHMTSVTHLTVSLSICFSSSLLYTVSHNNMCHQGVFYTSAGRLMPQTIIQQCWLPLLIPRLEDGGCWMLLSSTNVKYDTSAAWGLPKPDPYPELDTPQLKILENTLVATCIFALPLADVDWF